MGGPRQPQHLREVERAQPLAVVAHLRRLGHEDRVRRFEEPLGHAVDLLGVEHRPLLRPSGRVADPRRVVPDDQHARVALVLKCAHALKRDPVAKVDVRRRDVDPELHSKRLAARQLRLEGACRLDVDSVTGEVCDSHRRANVTIRRLSCGK